jgi:hypothetical protein
MKRTKPERRWQDPAETEAKICISSRWGCLFKIKIGSIHIAWHSRQAKVLQQ